MAASQVSASQPDIYAHSLHSDIAIFAAIIGAACAID
jgi:hypothetical protein